MPQQLPQIPVLPARYPNRRKVVLQQQTQNMLRILPIRLLFAPASASYLGRIAHPQLELQLCQQSFEPACVPAGLHSYTHLLTCHRQGTIELLGSLSVIQSLFSKLSGFCIDKSNLLKARVIITTYNQHVRLLSPSLLVGVAPPTLLGHWSRHCHAINYTQNLSEAPRYTLKLILAKVRLSTGCGPSSNSFLSQRIYGVDPRSPACWNIRGHCGDDQDDDWDEEVQAWLMHVGVDEHRLKNLGQWNRQRESDGSPDPGQL